MSFITTNDGTKLFYKDWNQGQAKTVVFVHAWAMTSAFWEYTMLHFVSQGLRCVAYDRRAHGHSDDPGRGYDFDTLTDDLHCLLEKLDLRDVTLVGHSMGGGEVLRYYSRYGHTGRVSRLVLVASPDYLLQAADNPEGVTMEQINSVLGLLGTNFRKWLRDNVDPFYLPETYNVCGDTIQWTIDMMLQTSLQAVVEYQRLTLLTDFREDARGVRIPTLVIHGDADASIPFRCGKSLAGLIPGCDFKAYSGAPHGLLITHAEQMYTDILGLVKEGGGR